MTKRFFIVTFSILFIFSTVVSYAGSVSGGALFNLLKEASEHPNKSAILRILEVSFEDSDDIEDLENNLEVYMESFFGSDYEKSLEKRNISISDLKKSLSSLKKWDTQARLDLIEFVRKNDLEKAQELIENDGKIKEENPTTGGGGGGTGPSEETPQEPEEELKEPQTPEEQPQQPMPKVEKHFEDIQNHWAKDSIEHMVSIGIVNGVEENKFAPEAKVTRNQMITFIVKLLDIHEQDTKGLPFTDVDKENWDYPFIKAAYDAKIINGVSVEQFAPNKPITREQMMVMVMNALEYKNIMQKENIIKDLSTYEDYINISSWAQEAMKKAVNLGIIQGKTEKTLDPQGVATRAEAITIIEKAYNILNKAL